MLVLSRNVSQSIKIGDDITITLVNVRGGRCRIGIDAPKHVEVDRAGIRREKDRAAGAAHAVAADGGQR